MLRVRINLKVSELRSQLLKLVHFEVKLIKGVLKDFFYEFFVFEKEETK